MSPTATSGGFLTFGQDRAATAAMRLAARGLIDRPWLIHGPTGSGTRGFLQDVVALLLCESPDPDLGPCNVCAACTRARAGAHPDVVVASPDSWAGTRQTNESIVSVARRWLLETAGAPVSGERRVVAIEDVDRCNESIQNALLKALEEPLPRHVFVLVAHDVDRLLPTVRSRCQPLRLSPLRRNDVAQWLAETRSLSAERADAIARVAGGRIDVAARYADRDDLFAWREHLHVKLLELLERGRAERLLDVRDILDDALRVRDEPIGDGTVTDGPDSQPPDTTAAGRTPAARHRPAALAVIDAWADLARDVALVAAGGAAEHAPAALHDRLADVAPRIGPASAAAFVRRIETIREAVETNAAPRLALEVAMLDWPALDPRVAGAA